MKTLGEVKAVKYIVINGTADGFLKADGSIDTTAYSNYTSSLGITLVGKDFRPVYGSGANQIAQGNDSRINNGQTAHGWGNHATQGYIKTFTDTTYVGSTTITLGAGNSFQRAALTGDVTSPANSNVTTIADNAVTSAKIATNAVTFVELTTIPTKTLIGRFATGTGDAQNITLGSNISIDATGVLNSVNTNNTYTGSTSIALSGISFQRAALTGDVTAALNDNTTTIAANAITTPKILNNAVTSEKIATNAVTFVELTTIPTKTLVGRFATGTGDAQNITLGSNLSIDAAGVLNSINTAYTGSTSIGLVAGSFQRAALTGDVTSPVNSNVTTIGTSTVNFNKLQNINTQRILGRGTAGVGDIQELTLGSNLTLSAAGVLNSSDTTYTLAGLGGLPLAGGIMTGVIDLNRSAGGANTGLAWWTGTYKAWRTYMSTVGAGQGPVGITPPVGQLVTTYALRNFIEDSAGYGWTFEAGAAQSTTPTIKAEIRSSDGAARFGSVSVYGGTSSGFLKANGTIDSTGYMSTTHVANAITAANITSWNDKFKSLKNVANLDVVSESGIYRQEGPANAYSFSATLNLNSSDGRAQLMMNRAGSGMMYRTSTSATTGTSWTPWITVFDPTNLNPQLFLNKNTDNIVDASTFKISNSISPTDGKFSFIGDYPTMSYGNGNAMVTDEYKFEMDNLTITQYSTNGSNSFNRDTYFHNDSAILFQSGTGKSSSTLRIENLNASLNASLNTRTFLSINPGQINLGYSGSKATISQDNLNEDRLYELPDQSGTIALFSDIPIPSIGNFVTVDTIQTVTGSKTFSGQVIFQGNENNNVEIFKTVTGIDQVVSGLVTRWYTNAWKVGIKRDGSANSVGYAFWFSTDSGSTYSEKALIRNDGYFTGTGFIKSGGSATQVLMADGSVKEQSTITGTTYTAGTLAEINAGTNALRVWTPLVLRDSLVTLGTTQSISGTKSFTQLVTSNVGFKLGSGTNLRVLLDGGGSKLLSEFGQGAAPTNMVTTDTNQTITGTKTFNQSITAPSFLEGSLLSLKTNIKPFEKSGLELVNELEIVTFDRKDKSAKNKIGIIADDSPKEFLSEELDAVDLYKTVFIQAKAIQELIEENKKLKEELHNLRELVMSKLDKL